jgi:hypothetical protein
LLFFATSLVIFQDLPLGEKPLEKAVLKLQSAGRRDEERRHSSPVPERRSRKGKKTQTAQRLKEDSPTEMKAPKREKPASLDNFGVLQPPPKKTARKG